MLACTSGSPSAAAGAAVRTATRPYDAPRGALEQTIAQAWQELLGLDRVGRDDHFFELGGHSSMAVQLVPRLRRQLGADIGLRALFQAPTLQGFAAAVAATAAASAAACGELACA